MSFRCDACQEAQTPRSKPFVVVAEKREKEYLVDGSKVVGWEVAREVKVCEPCYRDSQATAAA